jgi:protein-S-isoprenylcysteine O-methyltransferase Ste14
VARRPTIGAKRHADRDDLAGEHKCGDLGQIVFLFLFLIVWAADSFFLHYTDFVAQHIPLWLRLVVGVIVIAVSLYFAKAGLKIVFGETREIPGVISDGVFGMVRHPIYLGSVLFYLGMIIFTLSLAAVGVWLAILVFYHYISLYEERLLLAKFGNDYAEYMKKVPMWLPRLKGK